MGRLISWITGLLQHSQGRVFLIWAEKATPSDLLLPAAWGVMAAIYTSYPCASGQLR